MDNEKFIDESWKDAVQNERKQEPAQDQGSSLHVNSDNQTPEAEAESEGEFPGLDFFSYVSSLAFQTMIFLGDMPHPLTNQIEKNLKQARFLIDTLSLLKEKTVGNLSQEENDLLTNSLYQLQLRYVEVAKQEGKPTS